MVPDYSDNAVELIKAFEGYHNARPDGTVSAYRCPAGKWTIGWGSTRGVRSGMNITRAEAERLLRRDMDECLAAVRRYIKVPLTVNQTDALVSFVFNLGEGNFRSSTLLRKLNAGDYDAVPTELAKWNKATVNGRKVALKGLTRRRAAEAALFTMDTPLPSQKDGERMPQKVERTDARPVPRGPAGVGIGTSIVATILSELPALQAYDHAGAILAAVAVAGAALALFPLIRRLQDD